GRDVSFRYAWARATVINTGAIALLAFAFGDYVAAVMPAALASSAAWAAAIVVALTIVNIIGLRTSAWTQNWFTIVEVGGLVMVAIAGFVTSPRAEQAGSLFATTPAVGLFVLPLVCVVLTSGGWK